jgi:hypothetical protein
MNTKSLIMFVGAVVLAHAVIGCATIQKADAEEATLRVTITADDYGNIKEEVVGIQDGREVAIKPVQIEDPRNPIKFILEKFPQRVVKGGHAPLIFVITGSPACVCRYTPAGLMCQPQGCS